MLPDLPKNISDFAAQAVEYVRTAVGLEVEYDSDTLPIVDHYLGSVPADQPATTALVISALGAYFGEVVRRRLGGRWEAEGQDPEAWRVILPVGMAFSPAAVVMAAIGRDQVPDVEFYIPPVLRPYAEDTLERMGDVTENEYYSLCGRLDTLEHLHEVLLAIVAERAKNAPN